MTMQYYLAGAATIFILTFAISYARGFLEDGEVAWRSALSASVVVTTIAAVVAMLIGALALELF